MLSRVLETVNWLLILPYGYIIFFVGTFVGGSAKTPGAAAFCFWFYLAIFPVAAVACNLMTREIRAGGRGGRALAVSLVPAGVLAATWLLFPVFVRTLVRVFG